MWFIIFLTLFNSIASRGVILDYRLSFSFIQLSIIDASIIAGFIYALIVGGNVTRRYPSACTHPMFAVILVLLGVGFVFGWIGAVVNSTAIEFSARNARDYVAWPLCLVIGYRLLPNPKSARWFIYALIIGGVATAIGTVGHYGEEADKVTWGSKNSVYLVRTVEYITACAGMPALVLIYSLLNRELKLLPFFLALPLAYFCLLGQFAPLHRTDWVAMALCFGGMLWIIPKQERWRALMKGALTACALIIGTMIAIHIAGTILHKDFAQMVYDRIDSLLPTERVGTEGKAWDSRVGSSMQELGIWCGNPFMGQGFAIQQTLLYSGKMQDTSAYFHNGVTSMLATTGIFGAAGGVLIIASLVVVGRRMVRDRVDKESVIFGALCYFSGLFLCINVLTGLPYTARQAILFGIISGMMFRLRDMQPTTLALQAHEEDAAEGHGALESYEMIGPDGFVHGDAGKYASTFSGNRLTDNSDRSASEDRWS